MGASEAQIKGESAFTAIERLIDTYDDVIQPHIKREILDSAHEELEGAITTNNIPRIEEILTARQQEIIRTGQELREAQTGFRAKQTLAITFGEE